MATFKSLTPGAVSKMILEDRGKYVFNSNAFSFPQFFVASYKVDGSVELMDAANVAKQKFAGIAYSAIPSHTYGLVIETGTVPGAIENLSVNPGDTIYLDVVSGRLTPIAPSVSGVQVIRIGFAAPPNNITQPSTDLMIDVAFITASGGVDTNAVNALISADKIKNFFNGTVSPIPAYKAVAWYSDSSIVLADSTVSSLNQLAGVTTQTIPSASYGPVMRTDVVHGALTGLGAYPGQPIFLGTGGDLVSSPVAGNAAVIRIGFAEPPAQTTGSAVDLRLDMEIISQI